jgi:hypothetical protein
MLVSLAIQSVDRRYITVSHYSKTYKTRNDFTFPFQTVDPSDCADLPVLVPPMQEAPDEQQRQRSTSARASKGGKRPKRAKFGGRK